ncbi:MAG: hypothetical protein H7A35_03710 [Planctomycetales bacterium]|nr:hypothetical protein [bacterium]UNM09162.1 MAG: hypothetical protein H7A35_03710 [Planctomycetales bacterium]
MRLALSTILLSCMVLIGACGGSRHNAESLAVPGWLPEPALLSALPAIPLDEFSEDAAREASAIFSYEQLGGLVFDGNGTILFPASYALYPEDEGIRYAIYRLGGVDPTAIVTALEVHMQAQSEAGTLYFGLADYSSGRWDFSSVPIDPGQDFYQLREQFDPARHVSAGYTFYLAVLLQGAGQSAEIEKIVVSADGGLTPPLNFTASDAWYSDRVQLNWNLAPNAEEYQVFYKLSSEGDEAWTLLKTVEGGSQTVNHNDDDAPPCLYDVDYDYRVRGRMGSDFSEFSNTDSGYRRTPAPTYMMATDRMFPDRVELWFPVTFEDNATVDVFRDGVQIADDDPLSIPPGFEQFMSWADDTVPDMLEHEYYIVINGDNGSSEPGPKDKGCRGDSGSGSLIASLGNPQFFGSALEFGPPEGRQVGFAYYDSEDLELEFLHADPFVAGFPAVEQVTTVSMESSEAAMATLDYMGRPFIAYANDDAEAGLANVGLYLAWPDTLVPTADEDWNTILLDEGRVYANYIAMSAFDGGIGILYAKDGPDFNDSEMDFCWIPDPSDGNVDDVQLSQVQYYADGVEQPLSFDLVDYQGLPYVMYGLGIQGTSRLYATHAGVLPPQGPDDWTEHLVIDTLQSYGTTQSLDLQVYEGRLHAVAGIGNGETDCLLAGISSQVPDPDNSAHWYGSLIADLGGQRAEGVSLLFHNGMPLAALNDGVIGYPRLFVPLGEDTGRGLDYKRWIEFELDVSNEYEDIIGPPNLLAIGELLLMTGNVFDNNPGDERRFVQYVVQTKELPF